MTMASEAPLPAPVAAELTRPHIDWPAVMAGAILATAIALILLAFGAAVGLSASSPYAGAGMDVRLLAIAGGVWFLWVQLASFAAGGYVAARLARISAALSEHERDARDGLHGLMVWATGVVIAAAISFIGIGGVGGAPTNTPVHQAARVASDVVTERSGGDVGAEPQKATRAGPASATEENQAEGARRVAVITAFITAASILVGAAAAFHYAHVGGRHRDRGDILKFFVRPTF